MTTDTLISAATARELLRYATSRGVTLTTLADITGQPRERLAAIAHSTAHAVIRESTGRNIAIAVQTALKGTR